MSRWALPWGGWNRHLQAFGSRLSTPLAPIRAPFYQLCSIYRADTMYQSRIIMSPCDLAGVTPVSHLLPLPAVCGDISPPLWPVTFTAKLRIPPSRIYTIQKKQKQIKKFNLQPSKQERLDEQCLVTMQQQHLHNHGNGRKGENI